MDTPRKTPFGLVRPVSIIEEMEKSYLDYAMSVIVARALPDVRDGLKPVHRRIIYAMHQIGLSGTSAYTKSAKVVGEVLGKYHPHGDISVYDALVRLAQDFSMREVLVDGQGNFGCFTKDTKIKLTDGRDLTFADLIKEQRAGKKNYTYTVHSLSRIAIAEIRAPRLTRKKAKLVKIVLDNGEKIRCTPDHQFMLNDGTYKKAEDLTPQDAFMPLDMRISQHVGRLHSRKKTKEVSVRSLKRLAAKEDVYDLTIEGSHNFALTVGVFVHNSVDGDAPAAMRYTECRLSKISEELLADIEKDTVAFVPNFDATMEEPTILPATLPNLLTNGASGIAVGMATNIPPHNLGELVELIVNLVNTGSLTEKSFTATKETEAVANMLKGPDFPTGGIIYDASEIAAAYATGKGRVVMRARTEIEQESGGKTRILVTEIPFQVNKARLVARIADLVQAKRIQGIADLRDESDRHGMQIVIELKRDAVPDAVLNRLYKFTAMQTVFNVNMVALDHGVPKLMTLKQMLEAFINHRLEVITRRSQFELAQAKSRAHILEGLKIALDHLDRVIATIRRSRDADHARTALMQQFRLTETQATAILDMQLRRLAALERQKIEDEYTMVQETIAYLEDLLANPKKMLTIMTGELQRIKEKFATPRKTLVVRGTVGEFTEEDLVPNEPTIITVTNAGYIKRQSPATFRTQHRGGKGILGIGTKEKDVVAHLLSAQTHDDVLFFTNQGRVFRLRAFELPEGTRTSKGAAVINLLSIDADESITAILSTNPKKEGKAFAFMGTRRGTVKKTMVDQYAAIRRTGMVAIKLEPGDELRWVKLTSGVDDIMLVTKDGQSIRFNENDVRPTARDTMGVRGILPAKGDVVVGMDLIDEEREWCLTITANGMGKQTDIHQWAVQKRGGKGVRAAHVTEKTGRVVAAMLLRPTHQSLVLSSRRGQVIKLPVSAVPKLGRQTQGVILMRLPKNDAVSAVTPLGRETDKPVEPVQ